MTNHVLLGFGLVCECRRRGHPHRIPRERRGSFATDPERETLRVMGRGSDADGGRGRGRAPGGGVWLYVG